jgi:oligopeptide transport system permease protein
MSVNHDGRPPVGGNPVPTDTAAMDRIAADRAPADIDPGLFVRVPFDAAAAEQTGYERYSYWRSTIRTFLKSPLSRTLLAMMLVFSAFAFLYPVFSSTDPNAVPLDLADWNHKPGAEGGIFGTDMLGRDIWARTWYGTRTSLLLGFVIAFFDVGT